ncbi:RNA polymerase I enhancer binding protein [Lambiella insularis]|nr:RNA polymerase I enhancer binding protein [Lambiella insularis]
MVKNARLKALHKMGNTSSQLNGPRDEVSGAQPSSAPADEIDVEVPKKRKRRSVDAAGNGGTEGAGTHNLSHKKRKKKSKSKSVEVEEEHQDGDGISHSLQEDDQPGEGDQDSTELREPDNEVAEHAQLLLSLGNGVSAAKDDAAAASVQLVSEGSPVKSKKKKSAKNGQSAEPLSRGKKTRKSKASTVEPNTYDVSQPDDSWALPLPPLPTAAPDNRQSATPPPMQLPDLPQSMQSLDDIPSDDENLAPYLQAYENGDLSLDYGMDELEVQQAIESPYRHLATRALQETLDACAADRKTEDNLVSRLRAVDRKTKRGRKRNKNLPDSIFDTDDDEGDGAGSNIHQSQPIADSMELGQYAFLCTTGDLLLMLGYILDDQIPIDPNLTERGFSGFQVEGYQHPEPEEDEIPQPAKAGKLKRVNVRKKASNSQGPTLDNFVTRGQEPFGIPNGDDTPEQATKEDGNEDQTDTRIKRRKRRMPVAPPNPNKPIFSTKQTPSSQKSQDYNSSFLELADTGGQFTEEEYNIMLAFRDEWCAENGKTHRQFADKIHANARNDPALGQFWTSIQDLLPYRKRQPLQKFCRRKFHNFEKRGAWTAADDEMLKQAVAEKGRSWKAVGEICDRMAEDVRDRWRNYHQNAANRNHEAWTEAEVRSLVRAVGEVIWLQLEEQNRLFFEQHGYHSALPDNPGDDVLEKLILWQAVSDRMAGARGRLQCSYKWKALKNAKPAALAETLRGAKRRMARLQSGVVDVPAAPRKDWRVEAARKKVAQNMLPGDRADFLAALLRCGAAAEDAVHWPTLGKGEAWRAKWKLVDVRAMWDVLSAELEPPAEGAPAPAFRDVVAAMLCDLETDYADRLEQRWEPSVEEEDPVPVVEAAPKKKKFRGRRARGVLSSGFVSAGDEEEMEARAGLVYGEPSGEGYQGMYAQEGLVAEEDPEERLARLLQAA